MKLLYIFQGCLDQQGYLGVKRKVHSHKKFFEENGIDVVVCSLSKPRTTIDKIGMSLPFTRVFPRAWDSIDLSGFDAIYLRYVWSDFGLIQFLKRAKRENIKVLLEIPTYPYDEEAKKSLLKIPMLWKDRYFRKKLVNLANRVVTFSEDSEILGIPTICTINGIDVQKLNPRKPVTQQTNEIHIVAVAAFAVWHGYDRFIRGLGLYYQNGGSRNIIFHLVGDGNVISEYKKLIDKDKMAEHFIFYGFKTGSELDAIYDKCDVGIEILGCHRKNLRLSSTLKSREYWAKGLPFVSECDFPGSAKEISDYICRVPFDESSIDVEKIIEFYDDVYEKSGKTKQMVITEIRDFAMRTCDMSVTMRPVIDYIKSSNSIDL